MQGQSRSCENLVNSESSVSLRCPRPRFVSVLSGSAQGMSPLHAEGRGLLEAPRTPRPFSSIPGFWCFSFPSWINFQCIEDTPYDIKKMMSLSSTGAFLASPTLSLMPSRPVEAAPCQKHLMQRLLRARSSCSFPLGRV